MQTDAPTPHIVGPTMLRPAVYHGKDTTHKTEETMCDRRARPQQCWKSCANGSNIVALRFGDHGTKEMLAQNFERDFKLFASTPKNTQHHTTGCATGFNIQQNWELFTNNVDGPFSRGLKKKTV